MRISDACLPDQAKVCGARRYVSRGVQCGVGEDVLCRQWSKNRSFCLPVTLFFFLFFLLSCIYAFFCQAAQAAEALQR